ncbi:DegV family protein [Peptoniphilus equinus]|uniref:DegV family protein n=1 Tax=Peptoniphilus equinus TaxID=3016343 RepID=A0ABY7QSI5_9FIRM|nr:DegV family protein [Peptoniphilus equinus]WBW49707.1 DegV family protein [Peptoniphilus equinus]
MSIKIVIDSGTDLNPHIIETCEIDVLPIDISTDEAVYSADEISIDEMFARQRAGETFRTAQVSQYIYETAFENYAKAGDEVIYLALSSGLSATCASAMKVAETVNAKYNGKIHVYDTLLATFATGYMAWRACALAKEGKSYEDIKKTLDFIRDHATAYFSVRSLEFLQRGGRVSKTEAIVGGLLNIRPMLQITKDDGSLRVIDKARGDKAMMKKFVELFDPKALPCPVIISYGDDDTYAKKLKAHMMEAYHIPEEDIHFIQVGRIVGAHVGPEFLGLLSFDGKEEDYV